MKNDRPLKLVPIRNSIPTRTRLTTVLVRSRRGLCRRLLRSIAAIRTSRRLVIPRVPKHPRPAETWALKTRSRSSTTSKWRGISRVSAAAAVTPPFARSLMCHLAVWVIFPRVPWEVSLVQRMRTWCGVDSVRLVGASPPRVAKKRLSGKRGTC